MKARSALRPHLIPQALVRSVLRGGLAVLGVALAGSCATVQPGPRYVASGAATLEANVIRQGGDYRSFDLASAQPEECRDTCAVEPQCVAFTFVNPGLQGPSARCWLKNTVPQPTPNACCVSGVKNAPPATAESPGQPAGAPPPAPAESPLPPGVE